MAQPKMYARNSTLSLTCSARASSSSKKDVCAETGRNHQIIMTRIFGVRVLTFCHVGIHEALRIHDFEDPGLVRELLINEIPFLGSRVSKQHDLGDGVGIDEVAGDGVGLRRSVVAENKWMLSYGSPNWMPHTAKVVSI